MTTQPAILLGVFLYLHLKHFLCDFPLQTDYQLRTKGIYGHFGGISHALLHALATTPVFMLLQPTLGLALAIITTEFLLHYHIDWLKECILKYKRWDEKTRGFWQVFGADQMLHNFTYVGIVAVLWLRA